MNFPAADGGIKQTDVETAGKVKGEKYESN